MKVDVSCPDCGWSTKVDDSHLGKSGRCKSCGKNFRLEADPVAANESAGKSGPAFPSFSTHEPVGDSNVPSGRPTVKPTNVSPDRNQLSESELPMKIKELFFSNEKLEYASRPAKIILIVQLVVFGGPCAIGMLGALMAMIGNLLRGSASGFVGFLFCLLILVFFGGLIFMIYLRWKNQYYVITNERTFAAQGILNVAIKVIFNRHIQMISINTGIVDRWLGLNSVQLSTAAQGGGPAGVLSFFPGMVRGSVQLKYVKTAEVMCCYSNIRLS
jgi:membrane protein YdbS with pleckstrin-like domain